MLDRAARPKVDFSGPRGVSRTKQSFAKDADINRIVSRAEKTGFLVDPSVMSRREAFYGDFAGMPSYLEMQDTVAKCDQVFMQLPVDLRERFRNDPQMLLEFLADPANKDEAVRLGFLEPPKEVRADAPVVAAAVVSPGKGVVAVPGEPVGPKAGEPAGSPAVKPEGEAKAGEGGVRP